MPAVPVCGTSGEAETGWGCRPDRTMTNNQKNKTNNQKNEKEHEEKEVTG